MNDELAAILGAIFVIVGALALLGVGFFRGYQVGHRDGRLEVESQLNGLTAHWITPGEDSQ